jgi:tRNA(Arg) A34 adenosine deaminase TadA
MLERAAGLSLTGQQTRKFWLGAIGIRRDGTTVYATNGGVPGQRTPTAHAEFRLSRKLDVGSIVFVARSLRKDSSMANARPCRNCEMAMRNRGVSKVYYTINSDEYGCIEL